MLAWKHWTAASRQKSFCLFYFYCMLAVQRTAKSHTLTFLNAHVSCTTISLCFFTCCCEQSLGSAVNLKRCHSNRIDLWGLHCNYMTMEWEWDTPPRCTHSLSTSGAINGKWQKYPLQPVDTLVKQKPVKRSLWLTGSMIRCHLIIKQMSK